MTLSCILLKLLRGLLATSNLESREFLVLIGRAIEIPKKD